MKSNIKSVISLTAICAVVAILLAVTNGITAPIIEKQQNEAAFAAFVDVLPGGEGFEQVDISGMQMPTTVTEVYKEKNGGYAIKLSTSGYGSGFVIICGVNADGKVTGAKCISSNETLGYEKTYGDKLKDATVDTIDSVDTVASATKTTLGYRNAVKDALNAFIILGGGKVDLRDEAQILADNLDTALPDGEGKFEKVFVAEQIDASISAVYRAENGKGYVFVVGDAFIATDGAGQLITDAEAEVGAKVTDAANKLIASSMTEIDITAIEDMPSQVVKAYKTVSGNYVFDLKAAGYGINGDYHTTGEYIKIKVSATPEGKIISCLTVSQAESKGFGDACAEESFYGQFNGKTKDDYNTVDGISGATITTNGYTKAIAKVFDAINLLEEGA